MRKYPDNIINSEENSVIKDVKNTTSKKVWSNLNLVRFIFSEKMIHNIAFYLKSEALKHEIAYTKRYDIGNKLRIYIFEKLKKEIVKWDYMISLEDYYNLQNAEKRDEILTRVWFDILFIRYDNSKIDFFSSLLYFQFLEYFKKQKYPHDFDKLIKSEKCNKKLKK